MDHKRERSEQCEMCTSKRMASFILENKYNICDLCYLVSRDMLNRSKEKIELEDYINMKIVTNALTGKYDQI